MAWLGVHDHHRAQEEEMVSDLEKARLGARTKTVAVTPNVAKKAC